MEARFNLQTISPFDRLDADLVRVSGEFEGILSSTDPRDADRTAVVDAVLGDDPVVVVALAAAVRELLTIFRIQIEMEPSQMRRTCTRSFGLGANSFFACLVTLQGANVFSEADRLANFSIFEVVCIALASGVKEFVAVFALLTVIVTPYPSRAGSSFQRQFARLNHL